MAARKKKQMSSIDIPAGAQVLDLAGNTGLGAIHAYKLKASPGLRVTTFDWPAKEGECLENFRAHGVAEHCSFIGGDVFKEVPTGFDVVLIKHFLALWGTQEALATFSGVNKALNIGGQIHMLVPLYPESDNENTDPRCVDFYPAFFLGCAMGQGGGQKLSAYRRWLGDAGFEITKVNVEDPADIPPDAFLSTPSCRRGRSRTSRGSAHDTEATLARLHEYMVGPTRFMNLLSCFELGIIDMLREALGMTVAKLGEAVGGKPDAVEQLLNLLVKEGFVAYDEGTGDYRLAALGGVTGADLQRAISVSADGHGRASSACLANGGKLS